MKLGDPVGDRGGLKGRVVANIDRDEFSAECSKAKWAYLKHGVLVDTEEAGLVHYEDGEELTRESRVMDRLWFRWSTMLALWFIASVIIFQAGLRSDYFYSSWNDVACAACGTLGLLLWKRNRIASLMAIPLLAFGSFIVVGVGRFGAIGL